MEACFLDMIALSVKRESQTDTMDSIKWSLSDKLMFRNESKRPAPAMLAKSSRLELDLTASKVSAGSFFLSKTF